MTNKKLFLIFVVLIGVALIISACGKKTQTNTNTASSNTNKVVTEAPYTMSGNTKIFDLKLVNGMLNYKTMTFYAGDAIQVNLTSDDQPVDFKFQNVDAKSTSGVFSTMINNTDPGGVYQLVCSDRECGAITVTVINPNKNTNTTTNTNQTANTNSASSISKVELQRIPAGTTFSPSNTYETTTSFPVGDQFGISVTGNFATGTKLAHTFADSTGKEIEAQSSHPDLQTGTNGSCCFSLPATAGSYNLKLYINGAVAQSVPITVTEK